jgi:4-amino-4-deoxy-L-arabinose transferase-like glycosyltransferase
LQDCHQKFSFSRLLQQVTANLFRFTPILIAVIVLTRLLTLGAYPLIDTTESRYAEMARKMLETGDWATPYIEYGIPFWGKPPLSIWFNAVSLGLFGINEFSARLSALLLSIGIGWLIYSLAKSRELNSDALIAPTILASMTLFFVMSGSVATDQSLTLGITLTMSSFWLVIRGKKSKYGCLFFVGIAIGILSKGPVAIILCAIPLIIWTLIHKEVRTVWRSLPWVQGVVLVLIISLPWFLIAEQRTPGFLKYYLIGEHWERYIVPGWKGDLYGSGRARPIGTIWFYWLTAALPWSAIMIALFFSTFRRGAGELNELIKSSDGWRLFCLLWMLSPLLFFTISANVIWTYVLPGLPGCALLLADWRKVDQLQWFSSSQFWPRIALAVPVIFLGLVVSWQAMSFQFLPSQKAIVEKYYKLRTNQNERLSYVRGIPFSAQFYTQGKVYKISNIEDFQRAVEHPGTDFFVCPKKILSDLPDAIKTRLKTVTSYGSFNLFRQMDKTDGL